MLQLTKRIQHGPIQRSCKCSCLPLDNSTSLCMFLPPWLLPCLPALLPPLPARAQPVTSTADVAPARPLGRCRSRSCTPRGPQNEVSRRNPGRTSGRTMAPWSSNIVAPWHHGLQGRKQCTSICKSTAIYVCQWID